MPDLTDSPVEGPVEYDSAADTYRTRYEWSSPVSLTTAVIEVIAEIDEIDPRDVDRLSDGIDPEALNVLFTPIPTADSRHEGRVSFVLGGHRVTVRGTGDIEIGPASSE